MQIKVKPEMPSVDLNPTLKEKIRQVMSSHYEPKMQHLDLSRFYAKEGTYCYIEMGIVFNVSNT